MVQQQMDIIDLCDSDDDIYPIRHLQSGRDENDAISLSSDDDSIVLAGTRPAAKEESNVARSSVGISQSHPASKSRANSNPPAARKNDAIQPENPAVERKRATTLKDPSFPQLNATVQHEATSTQVNGEVQTASQGATICSRGEAANESVRAPLNVPETGARSSANFAPTKREDLSTRAQERPYAICNVQNNQNQMKRNFKTEEESEGQPGIHAGYTSSLQPPSSNEDEDMPDRESSVVLGGESQEKIASDLIPPRFRKKIRARKTVARAPESDGTNVEEPDERAYIQFLISRRMKRLYGANHDDKGDSSDDDSDLSSYVPIPKNAFSPPNPNDNLAGIKNNTKELEENVPGHANVLESAAVNGDTAGQEEHSTLPQFVQVPLQRIFGVFHKERMPQDASDISSAEERADGGIDKMDEDEIYSAKIDSLEGPVKPIQKTMSARRRRRIQEDEESTEIDQVTQISDSNPASESDDTSLGEMSVDKGFQGGVDKKLVDLREQEELNRIASNLLSMGKIDHLCSLGLDKETSLPTYKFSVHTSDDTIIYDFDVRVDKSNIPNAGRGVFLHFIGARELKPSRKAWGKNRKGWIRELPEPLPAIYPHGLGVTVKLKGEEFPDPPKKVRIGSKRIYTESDYVPAPQRKFSSLYTNCGTIELGQYGPFRPEDRKTVDFFDVKGFLFSSIPNEWDFGVDGTNQVIDITDEVTGDTHEAACRHIPMYVNEVGHDKSLKQTVCALDGDVSNVVYYIAIREPMTPGQKVELLVAYQDFYEGVRERKGYGLMNMKNETQSDDHYGTFLQREYAEREHTENLIEDFKADDIKKMMDWLRSTHNALSEIVNDFLENAKATVEKEDAKKGLDTTPLAQQLVALRRFEWISKLFERNLERQKKRSRGATAISDLLEGVSKLKWSRWKDLIVVLSRLKDIKDANGKSLYAAFEREIVSELCYDMEDQLITLPMVEEHWCRLAMSLTKDLCVATAKETWESKTNKTSLMKVYFQLAKDSVREILAGDCLENLSFVPKYKGDSIGLNTDVKQKLQSMHPLAATTVGKGGEVLSVLTQPGTSKQLENANQLVAIPRELSGDSTVQVNHSWYICWQVLYLIDSFAQTHLTGSTYTLTCACDQIGLETEARVIMKAALAKSFEAKKSEAKKRKASFSSSGKPNKKKRKKSSSTGKQMFFWSVLWKCLKEKCGWRLEVGHRPNDFYFFPPGVTRKNGSNRKHFFDSVKQIREFITTDGKWKANPVLKGVLVEEEKCIALYAQLKQSKSLPSCQSKEEMIDWIRLEVKNRKR